MKKLPQTPKAYNKLLSLEKIEPRHLEALSPEDKAGFIDILYQNLAELKGNERDAFIEKAIAVLDQDFLWEYNHTKITNAIKGYAHKYGAIPTKVQLAAECGLSRQTIHKHLKQFTGNPAWADKTEAISIMTQNVMGRILKAALEGDMRAAKLYMESAKGLKAGEAVVNNQNNYVQINKTVINQQIIQQLKPEQLLQIEQIIAASEEKTE